MKYPQSLDIDKELSEQSKEDYLFGGFLPMKVINESGDWTDYLPQKEYQNLDGVEPFACVSFTILTAIEILIKKKYSEERNYSDRFLASISSTGRGGNAPKIVCNALKDNGVCLESAFPFNVNSFEEYYSEIPQDLIDLAKEFNKEWIFKYDRVSVSQIPQALKCSPLLISVPAWFERDGKYYRPEEVRDNHATTLFKENFVFDSYEPEIKELEGGDKPMVAYRFYIEKRSKNVTIKKDYSRAWQIFKAFFGLNICYTNLPKNS